MGEHFLGIQKDPATCWMHSPDLTSTFLRPADIEELF